MTEHVTKELFNAKFDDLKGQLDRIEVQTIKTNGSVIDARKEIGILKAWKFALTFAFGIIAIFFPTLFFYYSKALTADIHNQIETEISQYIEKIDD